MLFPSEPERSDAVRIEHFVAAARRRALAVDATKHLLPFALAALTLFIAVLAIGTDLVPSAALVVAALALMGGWVWRVWKSVESAARVAETVDYRLGLNDTISTAYYLLHSKDSLGSAFPVRQAAALTETVEPRRAFAFEGRRRWAIAGALACVAAGCFVARYAVTQRLSIRPPFLTLLLAPMAERLEEAIGAREVMRFNPAKGERQRAANADGKQARNQRSERAESRLPLPLEAKTIPGKNGGGERAGERGSEGRPAVPGEQEGHDNKPADARDRGQGAQATDGSTADGNKTDAAQAGAESAKNDGAGSNAQTSGAPSLMSKMKDALSSMMAKVNPKTGGQKSSNAGDPSGQAGQQEQQRAKSGEQQSSQQGDANQDKSNSEESASGQGDGQTAEKTGGKPGESSSSSQQKGADSQSGVGKQDGDKSLRDTEQQQAMGKLAEILGKRSANLTGEMTVENPSGNQQLKTAYSQQKGKHTNSSVEINRNEVPARYRKYVQDYMEQIQRAQDSGAAARKR